MPLEDLLGGVGVGLVALHVHPGGAVGVLRGVVEQVDQHAAQVLGIEAHRQRAVRQFGMQAVTGIGTGIGIAGLASGLMAMPLRSLRSSCRP